VALVTSVAVFVTQARLSTDNSLLIAPHGLMYDEVTASSLVKVSMNGDVIDDGTTTFGVDVTSVLLHAAVYSASNNIKCVLHIASPAVLSVCLHWLYVLIAAVLAFAMMSQPVMKVDDTLLSDASCTVCPDVDVFMTNV